MTNPNPSLIVSTTVPASPIVPGGPMLPAVWRTFFNVILNRTGGEPGTDVNNITIKSSQISDATSTGIAVLTAKNAGDAREAIGAGTSNLTLESIAQALTGNAQSTVLFTYNAGNQQITSALKSTGIAEGYYGGASSNLLLRIGADGRVYEARPFPSVPDLATLIGMGL